MRIVLAVVLSLVVAAPAGAAPCILNSECADGDLCNGIEHCVAGGCQPAPALHCDDGDACTRDFCEPTIGCAHAEDQCPASCAALPDGTPCADATVCTRGDSCNGGTCVAGPAVSCDDGDPCTVDACDPSLGCVYSEEAVVFPCVPDCNGGVADYTPCPGDDNICTRDACLPSVDLIGDPHRCIVGLLALERQCQDADVCDGEEYCSPVLGCEEGPPLVCDDGDSCNGIETCAPASGCQPGTPEPDGTSCDDGRECTANDLCASATCAGTPLPPSACDDADPATTDVCEDGFGCLHCLGATIGRVGLRLEGPGEDRLMARGLLPPGTVGTIAPATEALTFIVEDGATTLFRVDLAAGLLVPKPGGTSFLYKDRAGTRSGVRNLRLQVRKGTFKWSVSARDVTLASVPPAAVTARLVVGGDCFGATVPCVVGAHSVVCR